MVENITDGETIRKIFKKQNMGYKIINLKDIYSEIGEQETKEILSRYEIDQKD